MSTNIKVKDFLGEKFNTEDAILLREVIKNNLCDGVVLDFAGFDRVPTTFLTCLLSDLMTKLGREYVFKQIDVKNLSNYRDYSRVVLGTTF